MKVQLQCNGPVSVLCRKSCRLSPNRFGFVSLLLGFLSRFADGEVPVGRYARFAGVTPMVRFRPHWAELLPCVIISRALSLSLSCRRFVMLGTASARCAHQSSRRVRRGSSTAPKKFTGFRCFDETAASLRPRRPLSSWLVHCARSKPSLPCVEPRKLIELPLGQRARAVFSRKL